MTETPEDWAEMARAQTAERAIRRHIPPRFQGGFPSLGKPTPEHDALIDGGKDFVAQFEPGVEGLRLQGVVGCGKTALSCAIAIGIAYKGYKIWRGNCAELVHEIRCAWDNKDRSEDEIFDPAYAADLILLDDLGATAHHAWIIERIYYLINGLYEQNKTMIVTSNATAAELADRYGEDAARITSRINEMTRPLGEWPKVDLRRKR